MRSVRTIDRALLTLLAGFGLLIVAVLGSLWIAVGQQRAMQQVTHTLEVENHLSTVLSILQDAESGQRGYVITGDPAFLDPYVDARERLSNELPELEVAIADNPTQRANFRQLRSLAIGRIDAASVAVLLRRSGAVAAAADRIRAGHGKRLMDQARRVVRSMKAEEAHLLELRNHAVAHQARLVRLMLLLCAAAAAALAGFAFAMGRRRLIDTQTSRDELAASNARLTAEAATREAAEAQIRQMHKMESIGQLTGGIAHDFNNMLTVVIGSLDMAKRRLRTDPAKAEIGIDHASEGAQRAAQLTARLLAFSRQQPLAPKPLDLNKLVGGMSEMLRRTIGEDMKMETVLAGGLWRTFADSAQLENAILNLCVNARDAMPDGGKLTIETSNTHLDDAYAAAEPNVEAGQYVMICVTDTGEGMPADVADKAFDPFFTTKEVGKGTGLGLSQVYGFLKQSGGHAKIYSEEGVGTTVKLYLPRSFDAEAEKGAAAELEALPFARDGEVVLAVEDEERVRHLAVEALRELGYTVIEASDAAQALAVLGGEGRVDLLFTDVIMPGMNGRKLAEAAVAMRRDLKVLFTTGYTRNAIVHNGMLDPDVAFLAKPFTIDQLAIKVRQTIDEKAPVEPV